MKETETFVIHITQTENASWQGQVLWANKNISKNFRSALELIKMIDQVVSSEKTSQNDEKNEKNKKV